MTEFQRERWHIGPGPVVTLVLFLIVQSGAIIWWASDINNRVADNEAGRFSLEARMADTRSQFEMRMAGVMQQIAVGNTATARVEERLGSQAETLSRIERLLERQERPKP